MIDITNDEIRKKLIIKYLDAETSLAEEKVLVDYYLENNEVDEDEQSIAKMIRMENIHTSLLSDKGVKEFDRIINESKPKAKQTSLRVITWISVIAASIALLFVIYPATTYTSKVPNTLEITQSIQQIMNLEMNDVVSVTASPVDEYVWVKAELKDGSTKIFIMSKDKETDATSLLAIN